MKTALLFTGQGSQYVGMMKDIAENIPELKKKIELADSILGYSLSEICFDGPIEKLKETRYTQPAIFLHSSILFDYLKSKIDFDASAGHSVGEYAALYAAGVIEFEDAIKLVSLRGNLMFKAGEQLPGTMFAVIGLNDEKVEEICKQLSDESKDNVVVAANYNSPGQLVVSGSCEYLRSKSSIFKEAGAKMVQELVVSGAFHSPLMLPAKNELEIAINSTNFKNAKKPVYVNVLAEPLIEAEQIKQALIKQLDSPVKWTQSIKKMNQDGIDKYIELGPGKVLQGLVKRTLTGVEITGFDKYQDLQNFSL